MHRWTWGSHLLTGVVFASLFASSALAQSARPIFASSLEKCQSPSGSTDGIAVFSDRVVGLEWSCQALRGGLSLGGATVIFRCNSEGEISNDSFQVVGSPGKAALIRNGDISDATSLISCPNSAPASPIGTNHVTTSTQENTTNTRNTTTSPQRNSTSTRNTTTAPNAASPRVETLRDRLTHAHDTANDGSYVEVYTLRLDTGDHVTLELQSSDFDAYLIVSGPSFRDENDDANARTRNAALQFTAPESGEYAVVVTSYGPRETGQYVLTKTIR